MYIINFIKQNITVIFFSILLFIFGRILLTESQKIVTWGMSTLIYLIGFHWIFAYFTNSRMFAPYITFKAEESDSNKFVRLILMLIGFVLCIAAIIN